MENCAFRTQIAIIVPTIDTSCIKIGQRLVAKVVFTDRQTDREADRQ